MLKRAAPPQSPRGPHLARDPTLATTTLTAAGDDLISGALMPSAATG